MAWVEYVSWSSSGIPRGSKKTPLTYLCGQGLRFNAAAIEFFGLKMDRLYRCQLYWDADRRAIGIRFGVGNLNFRALPISRQGVRTDGFVKQFRINAKALKDVPLEINKEGDDLFVIHLPPTA